MKTSLKGNKKGITVLHPSTLQELRDYGQKHLGWVSDADLSDIADAAYSGEIDFEIDARTHIDLTSLDIYEPILLDSFVLDGIKYRADESTGSIYKFDDDAAAYVHHMRFHNADFAEDRGYIINMLRVGAL